jgi:hypothetical protein
MKVASLEVLLFPSSGQEKLDEGIGTDDRNELNLGLEMPESGFLESEGDDAAPYPVLRPRNFPSLNIVLSPMDCSVPCNECCGG